MRAAVCSFPKLRNALAITSTLLIFAVATLGATLIVPAGGDLQTAINTAAAGDTIIVEAGATYRGPFILTPKSGEAFITIQSSRASEITGRVSPSQVGLLATLRSNVPAEPIIKTVAGAHHYKLIGLEISTFSASDFIYDLVRLGSGDSNQTDLSSVPHHLILDRLWVHGFDTQEVQRGISLNSAETIIINSYVSEIHAFATDTQAICGWNGPGPYQIINNHLEAAGENIMFGGADPSIPNLVPSDITIQRNYFFKPLRWKVGDPSYAGRHWTIKNLLETKNARRVLIDGNVFENVWPDAQVGFAILLKSNNQDNTAPWSVTEDVTFSNNVVKGAEGGLNILGIDIGKVSGTTKRLRIVNNLWNVKKIWFQSTRGPQDVLLNHNTALTQEGNTASFDELPTQGFVFRNNLTVRMGFGFKGSGTAEGIDTLNVFCPAWIFERNVVVSANQSVYPVNNFYPSALSDLGFVDLANGDFRLSSASRYKNAGTDGKDIGANMDALLAAQNSTIPTPAPTPTPTPTPSPSPVQSSFIQFSSASYDVNEDAGSVTITVTRSGNTAGTASVNYSSTDASALKGSDYNATSGTLTFAAGESSKSFAVSIINDLVVEGPESFNLTLSNASNANLGVSAATVNIVDNDRGQRSRPGKTRRGVLFSTRFRK
jgi:hypothetical protein